MENPVARAYVNGADVSRESLVKIFEKSFEGEPQYRDALIDFNLYKLDVLRKMKALKEGETISTKITSIEQGNPVYENSTKLTSFSDFKKKAETNGFKITLSLNMETRGDRKRFVAKAWRDKESEAVEVLFDSVEMKNTNEVLNLIS